MSNAAEESHEPAPPPRERRWPYVVSRLFATLTIVVLGLLAGVWFWAGHEGSLATTLALAGRYVPLQAQGVTGSLRHGGKVGQLTWHGDGTEVAADDVELRWAPLALLRRSVHIDRLAARRISVAHQPSASARAPDTPPQSLALPLDLRIRLDAIEIGEFEWVGPPKQTLHDLRASFHYDGAQYALEIDHLRHESARLRARATLQAEAPLKLDAALAGVLQAPLPDEAAPLPLALQATLHGPLAEIQARVDARGAAAGADGAAPPEIPPLPGDATATEPHAPEASGAARVQASARITPWAAQPLPEANAKLTAIDLRAFHAGAPHTLLDGTVGVAPAGADAGNAWDIEADLDNTRPAPWNDGGLPLAALQARLNWSDGTLTVHQLDARVGAGTIGASGSWIRPTDAESSDHWQIDARFSDIDPALIDSTLAAGPVDGTASASGVGAEVDFDVALQARASRAAATRGQAAGGSKAALDWQALRLQDARARGRWAGGELVLDELRVHTDAARLEGNARLQLADLRAPGGRADLTLEAPGIAGSLRGELLPTRGTGALDLELSDATRALAWARTLPGAGTALADVQASGSAKVNADWNGGWRDPRLDARLTSPRLVLGSGKDGAKADGIELQQVDARLSGTLADAHLQLGGKLLQGARHVDLQLAASGGRKTPRATLAESDWSGSIDALQLDLLDPALGEKAWQLASRAAIPLQWSAREGGSLELGPGELDLNAGDPGEAARIVLDRTRWGGGELATSGRLADLPLGWILRLGGRQGLRAVQGNVLMNGAWDVALGREVRLDAHLERASGDLTLVATDSATGVESRIAAGLGAARVALANDGNVVRLVADWESEHAGNVHARLRTELASRTDAAGHKTWFWAEDAPLEGELDARMPEIAAWSVLAPPGWRLQGSLALATRFAGTRSRPDLLGTATGDDLRVRSVVDGVLLENGRLRARLEGTHVALDEFTLHGPGDAGGSLRASGEAGIAVGGGLEARLDLTLDALQVLSHEDQQMALSGQVQATFDGRSLGATGSLHVDHALIILPDETRPKLDSDVTVNWAPGMQPTNHKPAAARPAADAAAAAARDALAVDAEIKVDLGDDFRVRGMGADTRLVGTLTLAANGPLSQPPQVNGRIETRGGTFQAYGQRLVIDRGRAQFTGAIDNPVIDVLALRPIHTSDQRVGVQVAGTALLPYVTLYSDPVLPDYQVLSWLLLGRAAPDNDAEAAMLQAAGLALLTGRASRGVASTFGLDQLSFNLGGNTNGSGSGSSVTFGKRIGDRLFIAWEQGLSGTGNMLIIFFEISKRWRLRGESGTDANAVDLIYRVTFN